MTTWSRTGAGPMPGRPARFRPAVEQLEDRRLLATGFLQGVAFVDANNNQQLSASDPRLAGALIRLYNQNGSQLLAQTTTDANGYYIFNGLAPGNYRVLETPPAGYANAGVQLLSQIDPATAQGTTAIEVTVVDPAQLTVLFNSTLYFSRQKWEAYHYQFLGQAQQGSIGQLPVTVTGPGGFTSPAFLSFCVDLFHSLTASSQGDTFQVTASPTLSGKASPQNWGRIGYLYNHYGTTDLTQVDAAGLQLAIYELEYGTQVSGFTPVAPYTTAQDLAAAQAQANFYIADSAGHSEPAVFLDATLGGQTVPAEGRQGIIATGSFNFANTPLGSTSTISPPVNTSGLLPLFPLTVQPAPPLNLASKVTLLSSSVQGGTVTGQAAFVEGLYHSLLDRAASAAELVPWVMMLQAGCPRAMVTDAIWQSAEHRGLEVDHFYAVFLHRAADAGGRAYWVGVLLSGASEQDVIRGLILSPEYQAAHASNQAFVTGLYADVLGRAADAGGLAGWLQALSQGASRAAVAQAFLLSAEADRDVVDAYYESFLARSPSPTEEQYWLGLLESGQATWGSAAEMVLASDEYFGHFAGL